MLEDYEYNYSLGNIVRSDFKTFFLKKSIKNISSFYQEKMQKEATIFKVGLFIYIISTGALALGSSCQNCQKP